MNEIRTRVLKREQELKLQEDEELNIEATLQALEEITSVSRSEMEHIAAEIRREQDNAATGVTTNFKRQFYNEIPAIVYEAFRQLPLIYQKDFYEEYQLHRRNILMGYLLWSIPPPLSIHNLYANRKILQFLYTFSVGGFGLWWMVDLFRIPVLIEDYNRQLARKIMKKTIRSRSLDSSVGLNLMDKTLRLLRDFKKQSKSLISKLLVKKEDE